MKKILLSILACASVNTFALVGDMPASINLDAILNPINRWEDHLYHTIIVNHSTDTKIDVYTSHGFNWDNYGWCNTNNRGYLSINPGETKVYCGGTSATVNNLDLLPHLEHEWWTNIDNKGWKQTYAEQWVAYSYAGTIGNSTKIVKNNDWSGPYIFHPFLEENGPTKYDFSLSKEEAITYLTPIVDQYLERNPSSPFSSTASVMDSLMPILYDNDNKAKHTYRLTNSTAVFYDVYNGGKTKVSCYALPLKYDWHDIDSMRQGENLCQNLGEIEI